MPHGVVRREAQREEIGDIISAQLFSSDRLHREVQQQFVTEQRCVDGTQVGGGLLRIGRFEGMGKHSSLTCRPLAFSRGNIGSAQLRVVEIASKAAPLYAAPLFGGA